MMDFMNEICDSPFWDSNITWNTQDPDFTDCFKNTVLQWIPCLYLWILLPAELYNLKTSKMRDIPYNKLNVMKLIAIGCIIGTSMLELGDTLINDVPTLARIFIPAIKIVSYVLFLMLTWANIKMGVRSSGILVIFSILLVIVNLPILRDSLRHSDKFAAEFYDKSVQKLYTFIVYFTSIMVLFVLNCFADRRPRYSLCAINDKYSPMHNSSFLSRLYFCWFTQFVWKAYNQPLKDILWYVDDNDSAVKILPKFEKYWNTGCNAQKFQKTDDCILLQHKSFYRTKRKTRSITGPLVKLVWFRVLKTAFWRSIEAVLNLSPSIIFSLLITIISEKQPVWKAYACVLLFFFTPFFHGIVLGRYFEEILKIQIRIRAALLSAVYKKALKISNEARKQYSGGDIMNFVSVDITRICDFVKYMNYTWSAPTQIIISIYILWGLFGSSIISSIIVVCCVLLVNHYVVKLSKKFRIKEMISKDKRGKFLQEILSGIKVLKMYAWESSFEKTALDMRQKEIYYLGKLATLQIISSLCFSITPFLLPLVTFATFIFSEKNNVLDVRKAFICVSFFNTFRIPMYQMPYLFNSMMQAFVSIKRINKFLNLDELDPHVVSHEIREESLVIENGTFSWQNNENLAILRDINVKIQDGDLVAIVGPVGAGKSSLISAFLGEMNKICGYVNVKGTTAYVPQQAWILNTTFKENITLGNTIDENLYNKVIEACALKTDLLTFSDGDMTEIGEKGINLSGGQKQRISLARALYSNKDIYFFDDPLSAVDFNVAEHIFNNVLGSEGMLKKKTRILVTHNTVFLHKMDFIVVLKNGRISESGTFDEIMQNDEQFAEFMRSYGNDMDEKTDNVESDSTIECTNLNQEISKMKLNISLNKNISREYLNKNEEKTQHITPKKLISNERIEGGNINVKVYSFYVKIAGVFFVFSFITLYLVFQSFSVLSNAWLAEWSTSESSGNGDQRVYYFTIYTIFGTLQALCIVFANISMYKALLQSSSALYNKLLTNVMRWPMALFDSTPIGRIVNRFTADMDAIDNNFGSKLCNFLLFFTRFLAVSFVITNNAPAAVLYLIPAFILMYIIQKVYMVLSHQLKRIDSVYRSPLYSHLAETVAGLDSIRAYNIQEKFISRVNEKNDLCSATAYSLFVCGRWLNMRLEILVGIIISLTSYFVVSQRDKFSDGTLAFIISYTIQICKEVNYMIMNLTEVENVIVSVERIKEFIDQPHEAENHTSTSPANWPTKGQITFQNYQLRYRDELDLVLKNVNFSVNSGEKVGIIGRTGAGKTSIISALFRIVEPASGKILVDGVDIITIGLYPLRSKLTVIPQDPVLFVGTLRFNIDPFDTYNDDVLWDVLDKAHLKNFVRSLPNNLYYKIEEGGGNLSFGQKQLICLARALLRKTKILVLDEATASVDLETDELIQNTIREEFSDCTVLTIAHRLHTIQDYDKILVMDNGSVAEYDTPDNLLKNESSMFYKLAVDSGTLKIDKKV